MVAALRTYGPGPDESAFGSSGWGNKEMTVFEKLAVKRKRKLKP